MTRVNRPDTLFTELRELRRRLRLLEGARMRSAPAVAAMSAGAAGILLPTRPSDWPSTVAEDWETVVDGSATGQATLVIRTAADENTTGEARIVLDGEATGDTLSITTDVTRHTVAIDRAAELTVEVRRTSGTGVVRLQAALR